MYIIGITGGTASGKSTFVKLLKEQSRLLSINFIAQDDYYKDTSELSLEEREKINFDHLDSLDFNLLVQHIKQLNSNSPIQKPIYNFELHNRTNKTETIAPKQILVLEGILILSNPLVKKMCDTTIYIDAPETIRKKRRISRDVIERGRTEESIRFQFENHISPMHKKFIEPIKYKTDFIFDGTQSFDKPISQILELIQSKHL